MGILVFLPGFEGAAGVVDVRAELNARGLADLLDSNIDALPTPCRKGPSGGPGMLVTFHPGNSPREYDADAQTWMEALPDGELPAGRYWLGYVKKAKPRPEDLQRATLIDGEPCELCDSGVWIVPCSDFAPKRLTRDRKTGDEISVVTDNHLHWVNWSNAIYQLFISDGFAAIVRDTGRVQIPGGLKYAALTLTKNYRLNLDAVDLLQLVDEHKAFDVARVACGMARMERALFEKKKLGIAVPGDVAELNALLFSRGLQPPDYVPNLFDVTAIALRLYDTPNAAK